VAEEIVFVTDTGSVFCEVRAVTKNACHRRDMQCSL